MTAQEFEEGRFQLWRDVDSGRWVLQERYTEELSPLDPRGHWALAFDADEESMQLVDTGGTLEPLWSQL